MPSRTFLPKRFFLDRGYAIVNVKNIAIAEPVKVTNIEIKNARGKVIDENMYSYALSDISLGII
jgi:hypothetical protein